MDPGSASEATVPECRWDHTNEPHSRLAPTWDFVIRDLRRGTADLGGRHAVRHPFDLAATDEVTHVESTTVEARASDDPIVMGSVRSIKPVISLVAEKRVVTVQTYDPIVAQAGVGAITPVAAVEIVVARPPVQVVVPGHPNEGVIVSRPAKTVDADLADEGIRSGVPTDPIGPLTREDGVGPA